MTEPTAPVHQWFRVGISADGGPLLACTCSTATHDELNTPLMTFQEMKDHLNAEWFNSQKM